MTAIETIVRPVVLPNVQPSRVRVLPSDADDARYIEVSGSNASLLNMAHERSWTYTKPRIFETSREFDVMRVFNADDRSQFVDVEMVTRIDALDHFGNPVRLRFAKPQPTENMEVREQDVFRAAPEGYKPTDKESLEYINRDPNPTTTAFAQWVSGNQESPF